MAFPKSMKAITIAKPGELDVLELTEVPFPEVAPGNVLIKVEKGGVNFIDTYFRKGLYPIKTFPDVQGMECAGTIAVLPTDEAVLSNDEYKKRGFEVGGKVAAIQRGMFTEYVSVPWASAIPVPEAVSTLTAAASVLQGLTATTFMSEAYDVQAGDIVLVHTVAGGLGLMFAQIAKARGATVIGTTSTREKAELARAHGADHVILYKEEDTVKRVLEITEGKGVHAVFDGVGKDTFESDFEMLRRKGTLVSVGNASGAVPPFAPLKLVAKNLRLLRPSLFGYMVEPEESRVYGGQLFKQIVDGSLKVKVFKEYLFTADGVKNAQLDLTSGKTSGKLVIDISGQKSSSD